MIINLNELAGAGVSITFEEAAETHPELKKLSQSGSCRFNSPITGTLHASIIKDTILVKGELYTRIAVPCSRCMEFFEMDLNQKFTLSFIHTDRQPHPDADDEEIELNEEDMGIEYLSGDRLNLGDALQEQVILALPFTAVCRENCKGICPGCGKNLNISACTCEQKAAHPAFEALKQLKQD